MTPEKILAQPPLLLTQWQREYYFENGYVVVDGLIEDSWIRRLRACSGKLLDSSKLLTKSNEAFDLGPTHNSTAPYVRRFKALVDRDPIFWEFGAKSPLVDIAADLVGPDVKFHSAKLNLKWPGDGEVVKWHQDIVAWPHTNYSPVTLGLYLDDVRSEQGPLVCIPKSHNGPLYFHTDNSGVWTGAISSADLETVDLNSGVKTTGVAGTLIAMNCRTIHGSPANFSEFVRPMALYVFSSADAFAWMPQPTPTSKTGSIVRGSPARVAHLDPRSCPVPPNWEKIGYNSIFDAQNAKVI